MTENLDEKLTTEKEQRKLYYTDGSNKVIDLLIGFFGGLGGIAIIAGLVSAINAINYIQINVYTLNRAAIWFIVILYICAIIYFFHIERKFISIGIIFISIIPLILFGGCLVYSIF